MVGKTGTFVTTGALKWCSAYSIWNYCLDLTINIVTMLSFSFMKDLHDAGL